MQHNEGVQIRELKFVFTVEAGSHLQFAGDDLNIKHRHIHLYTHTHTQMHHTCNDLQN